MIRTSVTTDCPSALQIALNDIEVSIENVQKLMKELQVRMSCCKMGSLFVCTTAFPVTVCRLSVPKWWARLGSWQRENWM